MIFSLIPLILGVIFLIWASYSDAKTGEVSNRWILITLLIGMAYKTFTGGFLVTLIAVILIFLFVYVLWKKEVMGGADCKILVAIVPFLYFVGIPNMIAMLLFFIIEFGIIGILYAKVFYWVTGNDKFPFVPAILLTFIVSWYFRIH